MISRLAAILAAVLTMSILASAAGAQDDSQRSDASAAELRALLTDTTIMTADNRCFYYGPQELIVYDDLQKVMEGDWRIIESDGGPQVCHQGADGTPECHRLEPVAGDGQILIIEDEARVVRATLMRGNQCG